MDDRKLFVIRNDRVGLYLNPPIVRVSTFLVSVHCMSVKYLNDQNRLTMLVEQGDVCPSTSPLAQPFANHLRGIDQWQHTPSFPCNRKLEKRHGRPMVYRLVQNNSQQVQGCVMATLSACVIRMETTLRR
jgi:hypothetical protein